MTAHLQGYTDPHVFISLDLPFIFILQPFTSLYVTLNPYTIYRESGFFFVYDTTIPSLPAVPVPDKCQLELMIE